MDGQNCVICFIYEVYYKISDEESFTEAQLISSK